jgi:hypothetical protein
MPGTSVIALFWPGAWAQLEAVITVINNKTTARSRLDLIVLSCRGWQNDADATRSNDTDEDRSHDRTMKCSRKPIDAVNRIARLGGSIKVPPRSRVVGHIVQRTLLL